MSDSARRNGRRNDTASARASARVARRPTVGTRSGTADDARIVVQECVVWPLDEGEE
jgi:hypothetical protein